MRAPLCCGPPVPCGPLSKGLSCVRPPGLSPGLKGESDGAPALSLGQAAELLCSRYEVEADTALSDAERWIETLEKCGAIEV